MDESFDRRSCGRLALTQSAKNFCDRRAYAAISFTTDSESIAVGIYEADRDVMRLRGALTHPPDMVVKASALRAFYREPIDRSGERKINRVDNRTLPGAISAGQNDKSIKEIDPQRVPHTAKRWPKLFDGIVLPAPTGLGPRRR